MLIELPRFWLITFNIGGWFAINMLISHLFYLLPVELFSVDNALYKTKSWEKDGFFWKKYFRINIWKNLLPDGDTILRKGFGKKNLRENNREYYERFLQETRRAEATHWAIFFCFPIFLIWNPLWAGWVMLGYAFASNFPCIIAQRYNRPRLKRLIQKAKQKQRL